VFTFELLADILLNKVKTWNDPSISTLNPGVLLPNHDILIAYDNRSFVNSPWIKALRRVGEFNAKVHCYVLCRAMTPRASDSHSFAWLR
jgi:hypothetical protein